MSHEQTLSLANSLLDKAVFTVINDILEEVGDRDDERKKCLIQDLRLQYPKASKNIDHILLSKNKRNTIKQDFLLTTKKAFSAVLEEQASTIFDKSFHDFMEALSVLFWSFFSEERIDSIFSKYVSLFLEEKFQYSDDKNAYKLEQKSLSTQNMITSALHTSQEISTTLKTLPNGLIGDIRNYLDRKQINGNTEKLLTTIEKIIQRLFMKNESIRKQWFIKKVSSYGFTCLDDDFFLVLESYGFTCLDTYKKTQEENSKNEDILPSVVESCDNKQILSDSNSTLLSALQDYDLLDRLAWESKKDYLIRKITWYADIFEKLGYIFISKEKFIQSSAEYCHSNTRLDKDIKRVISDIIVKNKQEQHRSWRNYYAFELPNGWRILLSKKGVISDIWPHDYYEKYLKNNF